MAAGATPNADAPPSEATATSAVSADDFRASVTSLSDRVVLVAVSGELDLYACERLQAGIAEASALGAETVVVDLSEVTFLDSTALGALVQEAKRLEGRSRSLILVTNEPRTRRVFEITGLDRVFRMCATLDDALRELTSDSLGAAAGSG
jgi:anti-sigma B factor antagonist